MDRVVITKPLMGICHMQVCAAKDATDEEILKFCNRDNPSGTEMGWSGVCRSGDNKGVQCADDSNRSHFLVEC